MTYTVTWYRFPTGSEEDEMVANWREFKTFEKALAFLQGRLRLIKSTHWAGGQIEESESPYRILYEVDWEGNETDLRCESAAETEQNAALSQQSESEPAQTAEINVLTPHQPEQEEPAELQKSSEEVNKIRIKYKAPKIIAVHKSYSPCRRVTCYHAAADEEHTRPPPSDVHSEKYD